MFRCSLLTAFIAGWLALAGCGDEYDDQPYEPVGDYDTVDHKSIRFKENVNSLPVEDVELKDLQFVEPSGKQVSLSDYIGGQNTVVVVTRGYPGTICLYCSTQVMRLVANYKQMTEQNAKVVAIFPVKNSSDSFALGDFLASVQNKLEDSSTSVPFPILLDVESNAVRQLQIEHDLSKPATYIIDKHGRVKFAYVGSSPADRPSVQEIIRQLRELNKNGMMD